MVEKQQNPAEDDPYAQYYVVQRGDSLSKIAKEYYGDMSLYPKIFEANRDILDDPNKIKPGQRLRIP
jgi:nucleoid-associated protein YgaU